MQGVVWGAMPGITCFSFLKNAFFFLFFPFFFSGVWFLGVCFVSLNRGLKQGNPTSAGGNDFLIIFLPFHPTECDLPALAMEL